MKGFEGRYFTTNGIPHGFRQVGADFFYDIGCQNGCLTHTFRQSVATAVAIEKSCREEIACSSGVDDFLYGTRRHLQKLAALL